MDKAVNTPISDSLDLSHLSNAHDLTRIRQAVELVWDDRISCKRAAEQLGISRQRLNQLLHKAGVGTPSWPRAGRNHPVLSDKEALEKHLHASGQIVDAASDLNIDYSLLYAWMKFHGIKFKPVRKKGCESPHYTTGFYVTTHDKHGRVRTLCSLFGYNKINPEWCSTQHTVPAHRLLIEKGLLGHKLPSGFEVHHADGNPLNNHPSNLCIVTRLQHKRLHMLSEIALEQQLKTLNVKKQTRLQTLRDTGLIQLARRFHNANLEVCRLFIEMENIKVGRLKTRFPDEKHQMELYGEIRKLGIRAGFAHLFSNLVAIEEPAVLSVGETEEQEVA